ncbi:MAG: VOC family protein, partial [bacterium]
MRPPPPLHRAGGALRRQGGAGLPRVGFVAVVWFEIPVLDLARAVEFYEAVLGVTLERRVIDGHEMAVFLEPEGAVGALAHGESY